MRQGIGGSLRGFAPLVMLAAALFCAAQRELGATTTRRVTTEQVVARSEQIFTAVCESKQTVFRNKNIVTQYRLRPVEFLKGTIATDSDGTFAMEQVGGSLPGAVPLGQVVLGTVPMVAGEEVLLFTRSNEPAPQVQAEVGRGVLTRGLPVVVSPSMGRYSILTDADTGEKFVVRPNSAQMGELANDEGMLRLLNREQKGLKQSIEKAKAARATRLGRANGTGIQNYDSLDEVRGKIRAIEQKSAK